MAASQTIQLTFPEPDIALLTFDMPDKGANVLSRGVLEELGQHLDALESRSDLAGLVVTSGKPNTFIAGADLREFAASLNAEEAAIVDSCRSGQTLFGRLAACPFVTVAAIHGTCVGGGAELAIWCDRRVMSCSQRTEFGFPEVKLGLFPGWGGTVRAPRIIGTANAVELITGGESISAEEALRMGLASDVVPVDDLLPAAYRLIRAEQASREYLCDREMWSGPIPLSEMELGFLGATASAVIRRQTKGHYPAPEAALETILEGVLLDANAACELEAKGMSRLFGSDVNAALLNVFFLTDRNKKDRGVDRQDLTPRDVQRVGVIGAGIMGSGIAAANVRRHVPVVISDASEESLARGVQTVIEEAAYDREVKGPTAERMAEVAPLLNMTALDAELAACDLIIEAIVENADVKRSIYARLEPQLQEDAILASNTSTIPIAQLAQGLKRPDRFCGIHFFNPVRRMKLVEVIRGPQTSDETVATAVAHAKRLGKMPIAVNDGPGFLVNRLLLPYMTEAIEMLADGIEIKAIERAAKAFGMPMGPIELYDMVGIDTAFYAGRTMWEAFPDRIPVSPILPALVKSGRLGRKSGRGFYRYDNRKGRATPDPEFQTLLNPYLRAEKSLDQETITHRLFLPMLLEATRVLEAEIVRDPRDVDLGLIFGLGFPPFKGGLLYWADTVGAATLLQMLTPFSEIGPRMQPTELLKSMAAGNQTFYQ